MGDQRGVRGLGGEQGHRCLDADWERGAAWGVFDAGLRGGRGC
jgi:hypothetical protein